MCGIFGVFSMEQGGLDARRYQSIFGHMTQSIHHRGPDGHGVWKNDNGTAALGHTRLSIIDLSEAGAQPMTSESGRHVISFNGELYNYKDLSRRLEKDYSSDTAVFVNAFENLGIEQTLKAARAMFGILLYDKHDHILYAMRDPFGKKPLYIGWAGGDLLASSELQVFQQHPDFETQIDKQAREEYLVYSTVPAPATIYKNVYQLLPGHVMKIDLASLSPKQHLVEFMQPYFYPVDDAHQSKSDKNFEAHKATVKSVLLKAVERRLVSDVPLGSFLSGGIDSSLVTSLMMDVSSKKVSTFTIGFDEGPKSEHHFARKVANHLGTDHHEKIVTVKDALALVPRLPEIYGMPFADVSAIPTLMLSEFTRGHVTVALSGDGGDEVFGGYTRFSLGPRLYHIFKYFPLPIRRLVAAGVLAIPAPIMNAVFSPFIPHFGIRMYKLAGLLKQQSPTDIFRELSSFWRQGFSKGGQAAQPSTELEYAVRGLSISEQYMVYDTLNYLHNLVLTKVDRATMTYALEARAPLLDIDVFRAAWKLPVDHKIKGGTGKYILREILADYVPRPLFERPKQGFAPPVSEWLRGDLRDWGAALLTKDSLEQNGFDSGSILKAWDRHQRGQALYGERLWTILMYQAWAASKS